MAQLRQTMQVTQAKELLGLFVHLDAVDVRQPCDANGGSADAMLMRSL